MHTYNVQPGRQPVTYNVQPATYRHATLRRTKRTTALSSFERDEHGSSVAQELARALHCERAHLMRIHAYRAYRDAARTNVAQGRATPYFVRTIPWRERVHEGEQKGAQPKGGSGYSLPSDWVQSCSPYALQPLCHARRPIAEGGLRWYALHGMRIGVGNRACLSNV